MKQTFLRLLSIGVLILMIPCIYAQENQRQSVTAEVVEPLLYSVEKAMHKSQYGYLSYNNQIYVSLDEICALLGKSYSINQDIICLSASNEQSQLIKTSEIAYYTDALIERINLKEKVLTLQVSNEKGIKESIVLAVVEDTRITHQTLPNIFPIDVLKEGMYVTTMIQTDKMKKGYKVALSIVLQESNEVEAIDTVLQNAKIIEINKEERYIHVILEQKYEDIKTIIVHVDHHTDIKYQDTHQEATLSDLREGMCVTIRTNNILTKSTPPHTIGLEVQIL